MPGSFVQTIEIGDDLAEVGRAQEALSSAWKRCSLPADLEPAVSLMLEEVLSNVLRHGRDDGRSCEIQVTFQADETGIDVEVSDSAPDFDPLARPDPDITLPLEKRRPGGLGIFLLKRLADEVSYQRRDGRNYLRFRKRFGAVEAG